MSMLAISVLDLDFTYPGASAATPPLFCGFNLAVPAGSRCLLLGQNGVGKTTLLRILAGKHMVPRDAVTVLGSPAFHDTGLCRRVAFLGGPFPFDVDMGVDEVLAGRGGTRQQRLLEVLEIDPAWRMHRLSAGQRRRVQVLLGLLDPVEVVLLDEVTADLDVVCRADLLAFLREDSVTRGTTVLYATHVLDGLERWATHLCFLSPGPRGTRLRVMAPLGEVAELRALREAGAAPLLTLSEQWLREDRAYGARLIGGGRKR